MHVFLLREKGEADGNQEEDHVHSEQVSLDHPCGGPLEVNELLNGLLKVEFQV